MMQFVFPVPDFLRGELLHASRLYAYPTLPELPPATDGLILLDSGAFHLSKAKKRMDAVYMEKLAAHYEQFQGERIYAVAPDEFLNPKQTLKNWEYWHACGYPADVVPVLQCTRKGTYDWKAIQEQALVYKEYSPDFICFSNPGLRCLEKTELLREMMSRVRRITGAKHLHNLGAGWDIQDICAWRDSGIFDSIDSISYYTEKRDKQTALENALTIHKNFDSICTSLNANAISFMRNDILLVK